SEEAAEGEVAGEGTLAELLALGGNYECSVSMNAGEVTSSGTVYISGSDIRGDFTSEVMDQSVESHMIQTGGYTYTWTNLMPQGMKLPVVEGEAQGDTSASGFDASADVSYDCRAWTANSQVFVLPTSVTFLEM